MKILVTGSAGAVGRPVCRELLRRGHAVRGLDRAPSPGLEDQIEADIADAEPVRAAVRGVEAVIHLAAQPVDAEFARLVGPNVVGLYNVMNAAREEGVPRVVLTSSMMVVSGRGRDPPRPVRVDEASPRSHYALTKLWAEMYARCHGMDVLAVRLGWMVRNPGEAQKMRELDIPDCYVSARDAGRFFALAAEASTKGFAVVYAASRGGEKVFDMEPARRLLGYEPHDRWPQGVSFEVEGRSL
jgi:uronate dehydrogenase